MLISPRIYLVASGRYGLGTTSPYDCNAYLVDGGEELFLIDSGSGLDTRGLLEHVAAAGFDPGAVAALVLTHRHADHAGGAAAIQELLGCRVIGHPSTVEAVEDVDGFNRGLDRARRSGTYPADYAFVAPHDCEQIRPGQRLKLGDIEATVHQADGHCDGHIAISVEAEGSTTLFTGDALLPGGLIVPQILPDFDVVRTARTILAFAEIAPDNLCAGHLRPVIGGGASHVELAAKRVAAGILPTSLFDSDLTQT